MITGESLGPTRAVREIFATSRLAEERECFPLSVSAAADALAFTEEIVWLATLREVLIGLMPCVEGPVPPPFERLCLVFADRFS